MKRSDPQGTYYFLPLTPEQVRWYASLMVTERCDVCEAALIDKAGRVRTKEPIWQYLNAPGGASFGLLHRSCCYTRDNRHSALNCDPMIGKHPLEWGAWTSDKVTLND